MATIHLFVYGTLKRGERSHRLLAGQEFVAEAWTLPLYRLYHGGAYPCLVADPAHGRVIHGEVWRVAADVLPALDAYEGVPDLYTRGPIEVQGMDAPVFSYFYKRDVSGLCDCGDRWPPVTE